MGGGREKAGWVWWWLALLPAESVRGGGLLVFWMRRGPTTGVSAEVSSLRRNSSSSGRPCLRPSRGSMATGGVVGGVRGDSCDRPGVGG